jgi:hypothetical protein
MEHRFLGPASNRRARYAQPLERAERRRRVGRILVASIPEAEAWFRAVLPPAQLSFVRAFDQAVFALRKISFELVVIHTRFDASRIRSLTKLPALGSRAVELAVSALGARLFLELTDSDESQVRARQALVSLAMDTVEGSERPVAMASA